MGKGEGLIKILFEFTTPRKKSNSFQNKLEVEGRISGGLTLPGVFL